MRAKNTDSRVKFEDSQNKDHEYDEMKLLYFKVESSCLWKDSYSTKKSLHSRFFLSMLNCSPSFTRLNQANPTDNNSHKPISIQYTSKLSCLKWLYFITKPKSLMS